MPLYRGSWYSQAPAFGWFDKEDRPGSNALGVPDWQQGIALPSRSTLGQWYNVTPPGGGIPYPLQQTDIGPAKWTGRGADIIDCTASLYDRIARIREDLGALGRIAVTDLVFRSLKLDFEALANQVA